jgi:hypothetical protein
MRASPKLHVERVEDRCVPAMFGLPWLSQSVTVSYTPDGTFVDGVKSNLTAALAADGLAPAQWQGEIQRALQAWAAVTNLNFGLVADGGQAVGTPGRLQGDTRFGDVRVTARPLDDHVLAITTPPGYTAETRGGDIVLNSNRHFGLDPNQGSGRYDLYTVMLQEVGHALGVGNSGDCSSAMYECYQDTRTGLADADKLAVRAMYGGKRAGDGYEGAAGNGSLGKACQLPAFDGTTTLYARGDVTTASDVDVYSFTTPKKLADGVMVRLTAAGVSLLAGKVELLDVSGKVLSSSGTPAAGADWELAATGLKGNTKYFARVTAPAGSGYRVGGYDLRVIFDSAAADPAVTPAPTTPADGGANDTFATATALAPLSGTTAQAFYRTYGQVESSADADVYKVTAPAGGSTTLTVQVASYRAGQNSGGLAALAEVYDSAGNRVAVEDLTYSGTRKAYQIRNAPAGAEYYVVVKQNGFLSEKGYELTAYFAAPAVNYAVTDTLVVAPQQDTTFRTLVVNTAQVFTLHVESASVGSGGPTLVFLDVLDSAGKTRYTVLGYPGMNYGSAVLLTPGEYTIRVRAPFPSSSAVPLQMTLRMDALTDPIGLAAPADPTTTPDANRIAPPPPPPFTWVSNDLSYYAWLL